MRADLDFAVFIDSCLQRFAADRAYAGRLVSELPNRVPIGAICPQWHRHGVTMTCYGSHKCRCEPCRVAASQRQKAGRVRRAVARRKAA